MKIVIIGLGTIGRTILKSASEEGHTIIIIDEDSTKIQRLTEIYDVVGFVGNGASMEVQKNANVKGADLVIALAGTDEQNILACMVAKKIGVQNTIARVRNPDYRKQVIEMREELGISMIVNPEQETAYEIYNLISLPVSTQVEKFAKGRVLLVEIVAKKGCSLIGETLISLGSKICTKILVCAVQRGDKAIIPSGNFKIEEGDKIHFTADARKIRDFLSEVNLVSVPIKNIMIVGGGRTGHYLANALSQKKYNIKLIEGNRVKAEKLSEALPKVDVICGNGTQHNLLIEEGIEKTDAFVALTDIDEENMIVSMFANKKNVKKTIVRVKSEDLYGMLGELDINYTVSPKYVVSSRVLSYIRAIENSRGSNVKTLYQLVSGQIEALEFVAKTDANIYDKPIKELNIKENCLIGCIIRQNEIIIPDGDTTIHLGDTVIIVTTQKHLDDLMDVFN